MGTCVYSLGRFEVSLSSHHCRRIIQASWVDVCWRPELEISIDLSCLFWLYDIFVARRFDSCSRVVEHALTISWRNIRHLSSGCSCSSPVFLLVRLHHLRHELVGPWGEYLQALFLLLFVKTRLSCLVVKTRQIVLHDASAMNCSLSILVTSSDFVEVFRSCSVSMHYLILES